MLTKVTNGNQWLLIFTVALPLVTIVDSNMCQFQGPIKITNALLSLVTIDAYNALLYYKGTFLVSFDWVVALFCSNSRGERVEQGSGCHGYEPLFGTLYTKANHLVIPAPLAQSCTLNGWWRSHPSISCRARLFTEWGRGWHHQLERDTFVTVF